MLGVVALAFGRAGVADRRAEGAELPGELAVPAHQSARHPTSVRAIAVEANAIHHHLDVGFTEASRRTALAGSRALLTGVQAISILLV